jgi:hypothetical protein
MYGQSGGEAENEDDCGDHDDQIDHPRVLAVADKLDMP